jgi:hypothetical protein
MHEKWTYVRFQEVLSVHEISNVECDLNPCLDSFDLLAVFGVVACKGDFPGSELGGKSALGRSSSGDIGDLSSVCDGQSEVRDLPRST